jgi:vancomycin resistance protein VanJ
MTLRRQTRQSFRAFLPVLVSLIWSCWLVGQFLTDQSWLSGLCFYIPSPLVCVMLVVCGAAARIRRRTRWWLYPLLLCVPLWVLITVENRWRKAPGVPSAQSLRIVHWNICRTVTGWERQRALLRSCQSEIVVLSEVGPDVRPEDFPDRQVLPVRDMLVACPWPMQVSGSLVSGGALDAFLVTCETPSGPLRILIADMTSNLNVHRDLYLQPFLRVVAQLQPDLIVGDFNAPRRSRAFQSLPKGWRHAYDVAGSGWSYTWPVPAPVLAIDQCIIGPRIRPVDYRLQSSWLSDHRIQILDFER